jgi:plasmid maintenance system antidote protein VapI
MNTNLNENMKVARGFEHLFEFNNEEDAANHRAKIIMMKFLHEMGKSLGKQTLKKKELATILCVSPSYVTQLYNGDKLINLEMIARIEKAFGIEFKVQAVKKECLKSTKKASVAAAKMPDILKDVEQVRTSRLGNRATKPQ